jgi:ankyrin repeat protein
MGDNVSAKFVFSPPPQVHSKTSKGLSVTPKLNDDNDDNDKAAANNDDSSTSYNIKVINKRRDNLSAIEAVEMNQLDTLKEIVKKSPTDILKTDARGKTLMCIACENGFEPIVKYLAANNDTLISTDTPTGWDFNMFSL